MKWNKNCEARTRVLTLKRSAKIAAIAITIIVVSIAYFIGMAFIPNEPFAITVGIYLFVGFIALVPKAFSKSKSTPANSQVNPELQDLPHPLGISPAYNISNVIACTNECDNDSYQCIRCFRRFGEEAD